MKRLFEKYTEWEDYKNGMYEMYTSEDEDKISQAVYLLTNSVLFLETCKYVVKDWKTTTGVHLTNNTINKKAWLGQACCSYLYQVPELLTRVAWGKLTKEQQDTANNVAETVINSYIINLEHGNNTKLYI